MTQAKRRQLPRQRKPSLPRRRGDSFCSAAFCALCLSLPQEALENGEIFFVSKATKEERCKREAVYFLQQALGQELADSEFEQVAAPSRCSAVLWEQQQQQEQQQQLPLQSRAECATREAPSKQARIPAAAARACGDSKQRARVAARSTPTRAETQPPRTAHSKQPPIAAMRPRRSRRLRRAAAASGRTRTLE